MASPPNPPTIAIDKSRLKKKDSALLELLSTHHEVVVHLDARVPGVIVPKHLATRPQLVLLLGLNLQVPIRDIKVEDDKFSATLSFDRSPFRVTVPWTAVYLIVGVESGIGTSDPTCMPPEAIVHVVDGKTGSATPPKQDTPAEARKTLPPFLRVIDGGKSKKGGGSEPGPHKPPTAG